MDKLRELSEQQEHYLTDNSQRIGGTFAKPHKPTLQSQVLQKSHQANAPRQSKMNGQQAYRQEGRTDNSGFAKKRVHWLIEHSTSLQLLCFIDSFELRNPLLRKAANR